MKYLLHSLALALTVFLSSSLSYADTLADIYELSLKNDPRLKSAEATYKANLEVEKQARSAFLPQISASASYTDADTNDTSVRTTQDPDSGIFRPFSVASDIGTETESYSVNLTQNIFDLPTWFSFKQGKEISKQARAQFAFDQQDLIIRAAETYFNVLRAIENLQASKAEELASKRQYEQTKERFDAGLIAITDVHEARAIYDATVVQRLTDEGNLGTAYESLTALTDQPHANLWLLDKKFPITDPDPINRDEWVQFALKNNYALKASLYGMEAAKQNAFAQKFQHAPKISGSFSYSNNSQNGNTLFSIPSIESQQQPIDGNTENSILSIRLDVPIFSGGRISSQRRQAHQQYNAALQNKIEIQRTIVNNTRASHITVATDVQRVMARQQAVISTRSALEATQAGYDVGTRNIVDVLQSQRSLYTSIRDYTNSRYNYILNMLKLKNAAGILTPQDIYDINKWLVAPQAPTVSGEQLQ
jgi:outer membrane protein